MMAGLPLGFRTESRELLQGVIRQLQSDFPEVGDLTINSTLTCWLIALRKGQLEYPERPRNEGR